CSERRLLRQRESFRRGTEKTEVRTHRGGWKGCPRRHEIGIATKRHKKLKKFEPSVPFVAIPSTSGRVARKHKSRCPLRANEYPARSSPGRCAGCRRRCRSGWPRT